MSELFNRTIFEVSSRETTFADIATKYEIDSYKWHNGEAKLPILGDTCYIDHTGDVVWNTNDLYNKISGNKLIKTDSNGVVIELIDAP